jgi:hypothetical protein
MQQRIKRFGVLQMAKVLGLLYLLMGVVFAAIFMLFGSLLPRGEMGEAGWMFGSGMVVAVPLVYGALGFVFGALAAWLYNLVASWTGGVELDLESPVG